MSPAGDVPAQMTAAYITEPGTADAIRVGPLPTPRPAADQVLVRTEALVVNHVDTFVRSGAYRTALPSPFVIGRDLVGTVVQVGSTATGFAVGDRVWCNSLGHGGRQGSFAQYAAVPAERLYRLPDGVDAESAAAVLHTAATAHLGLFREAGLRVGETIIVGGAAGGVGSCVVQLAAAAGARVIATARPEDADWCRGCGAAEVVDYRDPELFARLAELAPDGADVYWDNAGVHDLEHAVPLLARRGRIIAMAGMSTMPTLPVGQLYVRDASIRGFAISNAGVDDLAAAAKVVNHGLKSGILKARIADRLPLAQAADAHRRQEAGPHGRILVVP
ncbi:NADPH:quinone reductase [Speluncibacter jeojiensis]|uniref:NADPH:quinone reductase n=1 Tax=Speluncibacter jeojiensis TaxID=2710754 RepID=UPI00240EEC6A|nr:NADPH:quinone reductase [Rhodococcus sp. D2-41]